MKVYFAADHAGFALKQELLNFVRGELSVNVEDCGAFSFEESDDYPAFVAAAARKLAADSAAGVESRAIILGASGQGEAIAANRFQSVRAVVYYGPAPVVQTDATGRSLDIVASTRMHNDANVLSLGARFISRDDAKDVVRAWLNTQFSGEERHARRIAQLDQIIDQHE